MSSSEGSTCEHHGDLVGVRIIAVEADEEAEASCYWCGDPDVALVLIKSERHGIAFCDDCEAVLSGLFRGSYRDLE